MDQLGNDCGCGCGGDEAFGFPSEPTTALNYHFGMLLGVEDLRTEQAFHIGRLQRHQREAHGAGVLRGLDVRFDPEDNEIKVHPGYAIDRLGRDVAVDRTYCVSLPAWYAANAPADAELRAANASAEGFALLVTLRADTCFDRPVQAIAPECNGSGQETAFSRLREAFHLDLELSPAPPLPPGRSALAQLIERAAMPPAENEDDDPQLTRLRQLGEAARQGGAADLALFVQQALAVEQIERQSRLPAGGELDDGAFPIARIEGIKIEEGGNPGEVAVSVRGVDLTVRPVLMPTGLIQSELLERLGGAPASGPRVSSAVLPDALHIELGFDRPLDPRSVGPAAFALSTLTGAGFQPVPLASATWDEASGTVTLTLQAALPRPALLTIRGTGPAPLVDLSLRPLGQQGGTGAGRDHTISFEQQD